MRKPKPRPPLPPQLPQPPHRLTFRRQVAGCLHHHGRGGGQHQVPPHCRGPAVSQLATSPCWAFGRGSGCGRGEGWMARCSQVHPGLVSHQAQAGDRKPRLRRAAASVVLQPAPVPAMPLTEVHWTRRTLVEGLQSQAVAKQAETCRARPEPRTLAPAASKLPRPQGPRSPPHWRASAALAQSAAARAAGCDLVPAAAPRP